MKTIKTATLAALLGSAAAFAQAPPATAPATNPRATDVPEFRSLDKNTDGRVSQDEASANAQISAMFGELDIDKDHSLSETEYAGAGTAGTASPKTTEPTDPE